MKTLFLLLLSVAMATALLFGNEDAFGYGSAPVSDVDPECIQKGEAGDCEFYKCFSKRFPCASRFLEYGLYPTCTRMSNRRLDLNDQGKNWLNNSRRCFHGHLRTHYEAENLDCQSFKDLAIASYMSCADTVRPNMCQIFYSNRRVITEVLNISVAQLLENPRVGMRNIFGLVRMMSGCGKEEVRGYLNELKKHLIRSLRRNIVFPWA